NLGVERLLYPARYRLPIPREWRLCRFCRTQCEDEVHALFLCNGHAPLLALRSSFLSDLFSVDPTLRRVMSDYTAHAFLRHIVASRKVIGKVATYVCV
ncbi:hypothetical protein DFH08DRAFT_709458, partial [Mycena albidolilacea]